MAGIRLRAPAKNPTPLKSDGDDVPDGRTPSPAKKVPLARLLMSDPLPSDFKRKSCMFLCGTHNDDEDPFEPEYRCRWAYQDGSGSGCWVCTRVHSVRIAHECNVQKYQAKLRTDMDEKTRFHKHTASFKDRKKGGRAQGNVRRGP